MRDQRTVARLGLLGCLWLTAYCGQGGYWTPIGQLSSRSAENPVDINRASVEELELLPGIGPTLAQRIVDSRRRQGPFLAAQDLVRVKGIGPKKLAAIKNRIDLSHRAPQRPQ